jgi:hypothetical protein
MFPEWVAELTGISMFIKLLENQGISPIEYIDQSHRTKFAYPISLIGEILPTNNGPSIKFKNSDELYPISEFELDYFVHNKELNFLSTNYLFNELYEYKNNLYSEKIRHIIFYNCKINDLVTTNDEDDSQYDLIYFNQCEIIDMTIYFKSNYFPIFLYGGCKVHHLLYTDAHQPMKKIEIRLAENIQIYYLKIMNGIMCLKKVKLYLIELTQPDKGSLNFIECSVVYDKSFIKRFDPNPILSLNTYEFINTLPIFQSEKESVHRYILHFRELRNIFQEKSVKNIIRKFFFDFNGGYYEWRWPLFSIIICIFLNTIIIENQKYDIEKIPAVLITINPKILFNNIVFKDFSFFNMLTPDSWKIIILLLSGIAYYSIFCFLTAIKRLLGFPKD